MNLSSTRILLETLRQEIQKYPDILVELFPERFKRFSDNNLSIFWRGCNKRYLSVCKVKAKNGFKFSEKELNVLKEKSITKFNRKADFLIKIIEDYKNDKLSMSAFISKIRYEFVRISSNLPITWKELSLILTGTSSLESLLTHQLNPNSKRYDAEFTFSRERLDNFRESIINAFGKESGHLIQYINIYEDLNPKIKDYTHQNYTIYHPNIFSSIDSEEKAYWFGFLCADGHLNKYNNIRFELSEKDRERVFGFAKFVGLEKSRVNHTHRLHSFSGEKSKWIKSVQAIFTCKPMAEDLRKNGYFNSKNFKNLPPFVLNSIEEAKSKANNDGSLWLINDHARIVLSWLLGFYDGDGSYGGGNKAVLYSSNREILNQIKDNFDIQNKIGILKGLSMYRMNIGASLFEAMMSSYKKSMKRKRKQ
jgi:hypothetical protein